MKRPTTLLFLLLILTSFSCSEDRDDNTLSLSDAKFNSENELFRYLDEVTSDTTQCIDFVYPLSIVTYNQFDTEVNRQLLNTDFEFFNLLSNLPNDLYISLSYPITSVDSVGVELEVNNNEDLAQTIENCLREDEIENNVTVFSGGNGGGLSACSWKITHLVDNITTYNNSVLSNYTDGTSFLYHNGDSYEGNYIFYYINDVMHLNFFFEDETIGLNFNFDWEVLETNPNYFEIENIDNSIFAFDKVCVACDETLTFQECELENVPDTASFLINSFNKCILFNQSIYEDINNYEISAYLTVLDAENLINKIETNLHLNTINPEIIYFRVDNIEDNTFEIIEVNLEVEQC